MLPCFKLASTVHLGFHIKENKLKKSNGIKYGGLHGHATGPPHPNHICIQVFCNLSAKMWKILHFVSTFIILFSRETFSKWSLIHSPENICNNQLSNTPWWNADHKNDYSLFHILHLLKMCLKLLCTVSCGLPCD